MISVVIGAPGERITGQRTGAAYVYRLSNPSLAPLQTLSNPTLGDSAQFGSAIAISGHRAVIGAPFESTAGTFAGAAYLFDLASATPAQPVVTFANNIVRERFGSAVEIQGNRVAVGTQIQDFETIPPSPVYLYDLASAMPATPTRTVPHSTG